MNAYDLIAPYYDLEHAGYQDDVDLYLNYAAAAGAPILEVGCGSGRLLIPLAQHGYRIVGVDSSAGMLARARQRIQEAGVEALVTVVESDARTLALGQTFRLAFVGLNSFVHFTTRADQRAVLRAIRQQLAPGGLLVLDLPQADLRRYQQAEGQVVHQGTWLDPASQELVSHFVAASADPLARTITFTHFYDVAPQGGPLRRIVAETTLALLGAGEAELLLEQSGFAVQQLFGDYDLNPCGEESPRLIVVATRSPEK